MRKKSTLCSISDSVDVWDTGSSTWRHRKWRQWNRKSRWRPVSRHQVRRDSSSETHLSSSQSLAHWKYVPLPTFLWNSKYVPICTNRCSFQLKWTLEAVKLPQLLFLFTQNMICRSTVLINSGAHRSLSTEKLYVFNFIFWNSANFCVYNLQICHNAEKQQWWGETLKHQECKTDTSIYTHTYELVWL